MSKDPTGSEVQGSESDLWSFSKYSDEIINKLDSYLTEGWGCNRVQGKQMLSHFYASQNMN